MLNLAFPIDIGIGFCVLNYSVITITIHYCVLSNSGLSNVTVTNRPIRLPSIDYIRFIITMKQKFVGKKR